jgi:hypothetical protein
LVGILGNISQTMRMATIASMGQGEALSHHPCLPKSHNKFWNFNRNSFCCGIGLAINQKSGYQVLLLADALTFVLAGYVFKKLPFVAPSVDRGEPITFQALRDLRFIAATASNAINSLAFRSSVRSNSALGCSRYECASVVGISHHDC